MIDTHCHLNWESYQEDLEEVLLRAKAVGVEKIVTIGVDEESNLQTRDLVKKYPEIYRCVGYHPDIVLNQSFNEEVLEDLMRKLEDELKVEKTIGIGECGLDYYAIKRASIEEKEKVDELKKWQKELLIRQISLANMKNLPISLHVRDDGESAYWDVLEILRDGFDSAEIHEDIKNNRIQNIVGVLHCVSGPLEYIKECIYLGYMISFAGNLTYKNAVELQEIARRIPLEKIVIETDGPFLAPMPYRGKRNESGYVIEVAKKIAEIKNIELEVVIRLTSENSKKLFKL